MQNSKAALNYDKLEQGPFVESNGAEHQASSTKRACLCRYDKAAMSPPQQSKPKTLWQA